MSTGIKRRLLLAALAIMFSAGCQADSPFEPDVTRQSTVVVGDDNQEYTLVEGTPPEGLPLSVSSVLGLFGGRVTLAGHTITVPFGAVLTPTLFTMKVSPDGYVEVELTAVRISLFGWRIDVGSRGFLGGRTVKLEMSYARATNVTDPSRLIIVRKLSDSNVEVLESTVNQEAQVVETQLDHFSGYAMAL
jgi:hypothetical protein